MKHQDCEIEINPCQDRGWRGWFDYTVSNGQQSVTGRSRGTRHEVVSMLNWKIEHNEMFPQLVGGLTMRAADDGNVSPDDVPFGGWEPNEADLSDYPHRR